MLRNASIRIKEVKDLTRETTNHCPKKVKKTSKWKHIPLSWIGRLSIVKMSVLPKVNYRFNAIPRTFFFRNRKMILKLIWNLEEAQIARTILEKKNKTGGLLLSDFKTYYKGIVIKTVWS